MLLLKYQKILLFFVVLIFGIFVVELILVKYQQKASDTSVQKTILPTLTTQSTLPGIDISISNQIMLNGFLNNAGYQRKDTITDLTNDMILAPKTINIRLVNEIQPLYRINTNVKGKLITVFGFGQRYDEQNSALELQIYLSPQLIEAKELSTSANQYILQALYLTTHPGFFTNKKYQTELNLLLERINTELIFSVQRSRSNGLKKIVNRIVDIIIPPVYALCDGQYTCANYTVDRVCNPFGTYCSGADGSACGLDNDGDGFPDGTCNVSEPYCDIGNGIEKFCYNVGYGQCQGYKQCSQSQCSGNGSCSWSCSDLGSSCGGNSECCSGLCNGTCIAPTGTPTPTPTPGGGGGGCIGLGGNCLSDQDGCCPPYGCQTTVGLPGYGTCFDDDTTGACSFATCSGNSCTDNYYNPDPVRWPPDGCGKPDDPRCNVPNGCLTPGPTDPPSSSCSVVAPAQAAEGDTFEVTLNKNEPGGPVLCDQPTIAPSADCDEYASGRFTYCFDTPGCTGVVRAKDQGTCTVTFMCNNDTITCYSSTTIVAPSPTPGIRVQVHKPNGTNKKSSQICRVSCTNNSCTKDSSVCSQGEGDADFMFPKVGIVNKKGGRIELTDNTGAEIVVIGVTPSVDGVYEPTCNGIGGACYVWNAGSWTTGVRLIEFIVATPTPTLTPTPTMTPTPMPWKKISNSSFQSDNNLTQDFPTTVVSYDGDDTADRLFAVNNSGIATVPNSNLPAAELNPNAWYNVSNPTIVLNKNSFLSYVKARKKMTTLTTLSGDLSQINADGIYYYDTNGTPLNITTDYSTQTYDFVLIVDGTVVFDVGNERFNVDTSIATKPARRAIAILADSINFYSGVNFMDNANGIFVASSMNTGSLINAPLKIKGNIITSTFTNGRTNGNNQSPSVFVVFDGKQYVDLLPLLSVSKYDWRQLQ